MHERDQVRVVEQVPQLVLDVAVVDVDGHRAQLVRGEQRLDGLDRVARVDARRGRPGRRRVSARWWASWLARSSSSAKVIVAVAAGDRDPVGKGVDGMLEQVRDVEATMTRN